MANSKKSPPHLAKWIISRLSFYEKEHALGDALEEDYFAIRARCGAIISWIWYWFCTVGALFHYMYFSFFGRTTMFNNYLKITLRNLKRHKIFSIINISGLVVGLTCFREYGAGK